MSISLKEYILCKPKKLSDYFINLEIINKIKRLAKFKDPGNSLFYGPEGSGKYTIIKCLLAEMFGDDIYNLSKKEFEITSPISKKTEPFTVYVSKYHYEIDVKDHSINENNLISLFIANISKTCNVENNSFHIVMIKNLQFLPKHIQSTLNSFIDNNIDTLRVILETNEINKLELGIDSRCCKYRIPAPTNADIAKIAVNTFDNNGFNYTLDNLKDIVNNSERNLYKLDFYLNVCLISGKYTSIKSKFNETILTIPKILEKQNFKLFSEIREIILNLLICNVQPTLIFTTILKYYLASEIDNDIKKEIIYQCAKYQLNCQSGYRQLYHIEAFITKIAVLINDKPSQNSSVPIII